jgi:hypothetical protein
MTPKIACFIIAIKKKMSFYGLTKDYDQEIRQLQAEIDKLQLELQTEEESPLAVLPQEVNLRTAGKTILQGVQSIQYVASTIGSYFRRRT